MIQRCVLCGGEQQYEQGDEAIDPDTGEAFPLAERVHRYVFADGAEAGVCAGCFDAEPDNADRRVAAARLVGHELRQETL